MGKLKYIFTFYAIIMFAITACGSKHENKGSDANVKTEATVKTRIIGNEIELPKPPDSLLTPTEKAEYMIFHFWDPLDMTDTTFTRNEQFMEQNFANYAMLLEYASPEGKKKAIFKLLDAAQVDPHTFETFLAIADKYLYDVNSPMLNEESYIPFLEFQNSLSSTSESIKEANSFILNNINKNRRGTKATNFKFENNKGDQTTLWEVFSDRDVMLIFYDPECENCKRIIEGIKYDGDINDKVNKGELGVIAIYSGYNKAGWLTTKDSLPESWIVGYEPGEIDEKELYDLRATPTIYLLDSNKIVMEKDFKIP